MCVRVCTQCEKEGERIYDCVFIWYHAENIQLIHETNILTVCVCMVGIWDSMTTSVCTNIEIFVVLIYQYCEGKLPSSKNVCKFVFMSV